MVFALCALVSLGLRMTGLPVSTHEQSDTMGVPSLSGQFTFPDPPHRAHDLDALKNFCDRNGFPSLNSHLSFMAP